ncbi:hypothetical protein NDU88_006598 [Pleurodeles waltl]|uniref:Uncharacterized protein n=1 Tax=Pleurodeles waltl TaxID=8319 RepID=A0AAV7LVC0_PLEWA|nr:hypothetical protein NDU88_006598 [Pleurodeles waltl]
MALWIFRDEDLDPSQQDAGPDVLERQRSASIMVAGVATPQNEVTFESLPLATCQSPVTSESLSLPDYVTLPINL